MRQPQVSRVENTHRRRLWRWPRKNKAAIGPILRDDNSILGNPLLQQASFHAIAGSDDRVRSSSRKIQNARGPCGNGYIQCDGYIGIQINLPCHMRQPRTFCASHPIHASPRRRGQSHNDIGPGDAQRSPNSSRIERGVREKLPHFALRKSRGLTLAMRIAAASAEFSGGLGFFLWSLLRAVVSAASIVIGAADHGSTSWPAAAAPSTKSARNCPTADWSGPKKLTNDDDSRARLQSLR